jgi:hypothetical protein
MASCTDMAMKLGRYKKDKKRRQKILWPRKTTQKAESEFEFTCARNWCDTETLLKGRLPLYFLSFSSFICFLFCSHFFSLSSHAVT